MNTPFYSIVYRAHHALRNRLRPLAEEIGLSNGQPKILNYLIHHDRCKQIDLALDNDIKPATVSSILNNMEEAGLLERLNVENDKRSGCIAMSEKGRLAQAEWLNKCHAIEEIALKDFNEVEKEQFEVFLKRMYFNLCDKELD